MIESNQGNLLTADAKALINTVNTEGAWERASRCSSHAHSRKCCRPTKVPAAAANARPVACSFDALRYLRMTHAGRIRCIYIDLPYNAGNRDFVYNDRFVDKSHRFPEFETQLLRWGGLTSRGWDP